MKTKLLLIVSVLILAISSVAQAGEDGPELRNLLKNRSSVISWIQNQSSSSISYDFRITHGINLGLDYHLSKLDVYPSFYFSGPFAFAFGSSGWEMGYVNEDGTGPLELAGITLSPQPVLFGQLVSGSTHIYINYSQGRPWTDWELSFDYIDYASLGIGEEKEMPYLFWEGRNWATRFGYDFEKGDWQIAVAKKWALQTWKPWIAEKFREVSLLTEDRVKLYANWYQGQQQDTLVIVLNGFGATKDQLRKDALARAIVSIYDVLVLDFRGHGKSAGNFTGTQAETLDVRAALDFAHRKGYQNVVLVGYSMGGSIALKSAVTYPKEIDAVLTVSAPLYINYEEPEYFTQRLTGIAVESVPFTMRNISGLRTIPPEFAANLDLRGQLNQMTQPLLLIHGERDWLIPVDDAYAIYEQVAASPKKMVVLPSRFHSEFANQETYETIVRLIIEWLRELAL